MRKLLSSIFLLLIARSIAHEEVFCILGNKSINDCVKTAISENLLKLHNPNKDAIFDTIDPFWFQFGRLDFNGTEKVQGYFALKNVTLVGAKQMKFEKLFVKNNNKLVKISGQISVPIVNYDGFHSSNLKIEDFLVTSEGSMNGTFEDVSGKFIAIGNLIDENKKLRRLNITSFDVQLIIKNMKFKINGLSKDEILNSFINRIVNDSWQFLYQDLIQAAKSFWETVVIDLLNELFSFVKFMD